MLVAENTGSMHAFPWEKCCKGWGRPLVQLAQNWRQKTSSIYQACHSRWCPGSKGRNNLIQQERETRNQKACAERVGIRGRAWSEAEGSRRGLLRRNKHVYSWGWNCSLQKCVKKSSSPETLCSAMKPTTVKTTAKMCGCMLGNSLPM